MCPEEVGLPTGYHCNPEGGVFACMDWTAGSNKLKQQEEKFKQRTYRIDIIIHLENLKSFHIVVKMCGLVLVHLAPAWTRCKVWEPATGWL